MQDERATGSERTRWSERLRVLLLHDARHTGGGPRHVRDLACSLPCRLAVVDVHGWRDLPHVVRIARAMPADIIHSHSVRTGIVGRLAVRFARRAKAVHTYHGLPRRPILLALERWLSHWTAAIIHVSPSQAKRARHVGLAHSAHVVMNGIDHAEGDRGIRIEPTRPRAVAIGRWDDPVKGFQFLSRVAEALEGLVEVWAFGPGAWSRRNLLALGEQPGPLIVQGLCLLGTSEVEGCPYVVLEAMAAGVPVVARRREGYTDLVEPLHTTLESGWASCSYTRDRGTGFLVTTPAEMAEEVRRLAKDEPLRRWMGEQAREASRAYTLERMARETMAVYESIA